MQTQTLSRLMALSWKIQRTNRKAMAYQQARTKALRAAWAIYQYEEITVYYLREKHSHRNNPNKSKSPNSYSLF